MIKTVPSMFIRIVKMSFTPEKIDLFLENFEKNKFKIRTFKGCNNLELYQDKNNPSIFFTYSYWESEKHLERYRESELFKIVWAKTKTFFNDKPQAWSVNRLQKVTL